MSLCIIAIKRLISAMEALRKERNIMMLPRADWILQR